ncbi:MAG: hypothetical protein AAF629_30650 [Chloroflexota bacterium]
MSKQSKKQKKRRERQKRRRRQTLLNAFNGLYPTAPPEIGSIIVEHYLATGPSPHQTELSNTAAIKQATLVYVRQNLTNYQESVDDYIEAVLGHISEGKAYTAHTPQTLEDEPNMEAKQIIDSWRA